MPTISHRNYWDQVNSWKIFRKFCSGPICKNKSGSFPQLDDSAYWKSSNTKACAKKLSQVLAKQHWQSRKGDWSHNLCAVVWNNLNTTNSLVMFNLSVLDWKYPFWVNLIQKMKIVSLSWNLVPILIQICIIQWWCSLFLFSTRNTFLGKFGPKIKVVSLRWNLVPRLIRTCRIQWWCSIFRFRLKKPFLGKFSPKNQNCHV